MVECFANELLCLLLFLDLLLLEGNDGILVGCTVLNVLLLRIDQGLSLLFVLVAAADISLNAQLCGCLIVQACWYRGRIERLGALIRPDGPRIRRGHRRLGWKLQQLLSFDRVDGARDAIVRNLRLRDVKVADSTVQDGRARVLIALLKVFQMILDHL